MPNDEKQAPEPMGKTMLYTRDGELAVAAGATRQKIALERGKIACFYQAFPDDEIDDQIKSGWLMFEDIIKPAPVAEPSAEEKPRRGRPPKSATEGAGNDASGNAG
ncbi:MAG: hypothetical protein H6926_08435 [Chromatiales bacterium]|nr:hypothetical protein [Gammaproteobacteria bacterium]MCP5353193.1 hypothetical protein [Chromatiales bacterium]